MPLSREDGAVPLVLGEDVGCQWLLKVYQDVFLQQSSPEGAGQSERVDPVRAVLQPSHDGLRIGVHAWRMAASLQSGSDLRACDTPPGPQPARPACQLPMGTSGTEEAGRPCGMGPGR